MPRNQNHSHISRAQRNDLGRQPLFFRIGIFFFFSRFSLLLSNCIFISSSRPDQSIVYERGIIYIVALCMSSVSLHLHFASHDTTNKCRYTIVPASLCLFVMRTKLLGLSPSFQISLCLTLEQGMRWIIILLWITVPVCKI